MNSKQPLPPHHPDFGVQLDVIPLNRSYWVVPGRFLAGVYPSSADPAEAADKLQKLLAIGIRHFVNLTEPGESTWEGMPLTDYELELTALAGRKNAQVICRRRLIRDLDVPTVDEMRSILDEIDEAVRAGRPVYFHCWGDRGRTGTVAGCYLARHGMAMGDNALNTVRYLRRTDAKANTEPPETPVQKAFVRAWAVGE
jgi:hypothetical protein